MDHASKSTRGRRTAEPADPLRTLGPPSGLQPTAHHGFYQTRSPTERLSQEIQYALDRRSRQTSRTFAPAYPPSGQGLDLLFARLAEPLLEPWGRCLAPGSSSQ